MAALSREEYLKQREERVEQLTEAMREKVESIASGEKAQELVRFAAQFRSRSPRNAMLIYQQWETRNAVRGPDDQIPAPSLLAGYKQFQEMGRQVRKGEKGYAILSPVTARFASSTPEVESSYRRLAPKERPNPGETVKTKMVGVKPATVFDIAQTDGPEVPSLPRWERLEPGRAPDGLKEGVVAQLKERGFSVEFTPDVPGGAEGLTNYENRQVFIKSTNNDREQVSTLLHELGHVVLHDPTGGERAHRGQREFEAETFAHVMASLHGMDTTASSSTYSANWTFSATHGREEDVVKLTTESATKVSAAVNMVLDSLPAGAVVPTGAPKGVGEKAEAKESPNDVRVRNAMRMEARVPARIRDEDPVDSAPKISKRAKR